MAVLLNNNRIRTSTPSQLRDYYNELSTQAPEELITTQLLDAIYNNSNPPVTYAPWLGVAKSSVVIRQSLLQKQSILVRRLAVKQFCKNLQSSKWKAMWEGVGSIPGILEILADLSVMQVKMICKAIGRCARGNDMYEKRRYITELFKSLHPHIFPDAKHQKKDNRPLANHYGRLISACTSDLIITAFAGNLKGIWKYTKERHLLEHHPEELGKKQLTSITRGNLDEINQEHLGVLTNRYRATIPSEHGFSASMKFAMTCLQELIRAQPSKVDETFVVNDLIRPLLNRAVRKRIKWSQIVEIVVLTLQYLENRPLAGKLINSTVGHVLHLIARCWARQPNLFETHLRTLLDHPEYGTSCLDTLTSWGSFLSEIVPSRRYALMKFCIYASTNLDIDLDTDLSQIKGELSESLLIRLGRIRALELFNRVRKVRGNYAFLEGNGANSILGLGMAYHVAIRDSEIWHIHLLKRKGDYHAAHDFAEKNIEFKRKTANSASQPEQRAHYAKAALFSAIASGSLDCYSDNIKWAQRFLNDSFVLQELYPRSFPMEAVQILSGIPESIDGSFTVSALRNGIEKANAILAGMFGTACSAMMQPSFSSSNWRGVLDLFQHVVEERIMLTEKLSKTLKVSSDELYDSLWTATIKMLIELEEKANSEVCKKLEANRLGGLLDFSWAGTELKAGVATIPTLRFFDCLSQARDELWRKIRAAKHPGLNKLPESLPRGLPIQYLTAYWMLEVEDLEAHTPYLASRVREVLFVNPVLAFQIIPTDDDYQKLIGVFVDSYEHALKLYIPESCTKTLKQARLKEVWDFATGPLSRGRIHSVDLLHYWQKAIPEYLTKWLPKENSTVEPWNKLPIPNDPKSPIPWDPLGFEYTEKLEIESGKPRYIDISVTIGEIYNFADISYMLSLEDHAYEERGSYHRSLWNQDCKMSESEVLSALLYIDARFSDEDRLLQAPYPSTDDPRYPAIYIDEKFMERSETSALNVVKSLRGHVGNTPSELLCRLARRVMHALDVAETASDSSEYYRTHEIQSTVMFLIVRLGESDNPTLAIQLLVDTIISRPTSSAWHRDLLKIRFLRNLSASDAAHCFQTLAKRICEISQDHMDTKGISEIAAGQSSALSREEDEQKSRTRPYVKVTTIKMLLQLLQGTEILGQNTAIGTLKSLYTVITHVDVRLSIVKTLLGMLDRYESSYTQNILEFLELITEEAGNLNEREPLTLHDWEKAEASVEPPDIRSTMDEPISTSSPMLNALVAHIRGIDSDANYLKPYLDRIIFPLFRNSKQQTTRWLSIFLRKHGIDEIVQQDIEIPSVPHRTDLVFLQALLAEKDGNKIDIIPPSTLRNLVDYAIFTLAPPVPIAALNKRLKSDPQLSSQLDTQTYNILYTDSIHATKIFRSYDLIALTARLSSNTVPSYPNNGGITFDLAQAQLHHLFTAVLQNDRPTFPVLSNNLLSSLLSAKYLAQPWWPIHGKPLVASLIAHVSSLRTHQWRTNPQRHPAVLPETLPWQLMLIDFPMPSATDRQANTEAKCDLFASQIHEVLTAQQGHVIPKGSGFIAIFEHLRTYLALWPGAAPRTQFDVHKQALARNMLLSATYVWEKGVKVGKGCEIVLFVARILVERASVVASYTALKRKEGYVLDRMHDMIAQWKGSQEEEVRRVGWELELKLFEA